MSSQSIDKTVSRVNQFISEAQYYEAHQAVRTVVNRLLRKKDYGSAIGLLYSSALLLLKAGQSGSGSDLILYILKIYTDAKIKVDGPSKGRIAELVYQVDPTDTVLKQIAMQTMRSWAVGEADLSHVFGVQFLRGRNLVDAERYLFQGSVDSAILMANVHEKLQPQIPIDHLMARAVFGYLAVQNIRGAYAYIQVIEMANVANADSLDLMRMFVETCQTKDAQLYKRFTHILDLKSTFGDFSGAIQVIEKDYFQIFPYKQPSLSDLLGGMM